MISLINSRSKNKKVHMIKITNQLFIPLLTYIHIQTYTRKLAHMHTHKEINIYI